MIFQRLHGIVLVGLVLILGQLPGCSSTSAEPDVQPTATGSTVVGGASQTGTAGGPLAEALQVRVTDQNGSPMGSVTVTWSASAGGSVSPASSASGTDGISETTWTLGPAAGNQSATASVGGLAPVTFAATAVAGPATGVTVAPDLTVLQSLGDAVQLTATVVDANGNANSSSVDWSSSDPSVAAVSPAGVVTATADGEATITAMVEGIPGAATVTVAQKAVSITLAPQSDTLGTGESVSLQADVRDLGGSALGAPSLEWASSDETVATVDASGVVTALAKGTAVISASQDDATDAVDLTVVTADLRPTEDIVLSGDVITGAFVVPAGVTVTVQNALDLTAEGPIELAGSIAGDCVGLSLASTADIEVTGTIHTICSQVPDDPALIPTFEVIGVNVTFDGATIETSGDGSFELADPPAAIGGQGAATGSAGGSYAIRNTTMRKSPATANAGSPASEGTHGSGWAWSLKEGDGLALHDVVIIAQHGGAGGSSERSGNEEQVFALGGHGGHGGNIFASGGVIGFSGNIQVIAGDGGAGGPATATALPNSAFPDQAPSANASAGDGGPGGFVGFSRGQDGKGGRGGNAKATGADGLSAAVMNGPAQAGGDASAESGNGGRGGAGNEGVLAGPGGNHTSHAGRGGDGAQPNPDGATGGSNKAGGAQTLDGRLGPGGHITVSGGRGGADACMPGQPTFLSALISVLSDPAMSDQFIFQAGSSGLPLSLTSVLQTEQAGAGGTGGGVSYSAPGENRAAPAMLIEDTGNGGDGGNGGPPGAGGSTPGHPGIPWITDLTVTNSFEDGNVGGPCPGTSAAANPRVVTTVGARSSAGVRPITFTSPDSRWVEASGTLADDNSFSADGRGVVAGTPGVLVQFTGTFDPQTGQLVGDYAMDPEKLIVPGHPIVYRVEAGG